MKLDKLARYAWSVLGLNLLVILWGAYVRATGSGAGCGSHWPLCNGEVLPRAPEVATLIEFTHRATSGLALLAVIALFLWTRRAHPAGHPMRLGAALSLVFIVIEALLGAGLVLFELVAEDDSNLRAFSMVAHLINTFLLVGVLTLTAWWASGGASLRSRGDRGITVLLVGAFLGMLAVGATGAIAALGDTLFPSATLSDGLRESFSSDAHPLIQLRKYHPLMAVLVGAFVVWVSHRVASRSDRTTKRLARGLAVLYGLQLLVGMTNIILLAPVALQLLHLAMADGVWIMLVLLAAAYYGGGAPELMGVGDAHRRSETHLAARTAS